MCIKPYRPVYSCTGTQAPGEHQRFHVQDLTDLTDDRIVFDDQGILVHKFRNIKYG